MLKRVEADLWDWLEYHTRLLETSALGYNPRSTIGRIMEEGPAPQRGRKGSVVPFLGKAPPHVTDIHKVMEHLPNDRLELIREYYVDRSLSKRASVYRKIDRLHHEIQGGLWMLR